jgi:hypothetical protein
MEISLLMLFRGKLLFCCENHKKNTQMLSVGRIQSFVMLKHVILVVTIYLCLYSPFVGPWPHFQFLNPMHN